MPPGVCCGRGFRLGLPKITFKRPKGTADWQSRRTRSGRRPMRRPYTGSLDAHHVWRTTGFQASGVMSLTRRRRIDSGLSHSGRRSIGPLRPRIRTPPGRGAWNPRWNAGGSPAYEPLRPPPPPGLPRRVPTALGGPGRRPSRVRALCAVAAADREAGMMASLQEAARDWSKAKHAQREHALIVSGLITGLSVGSVPRDEHTIRLQWKSLPFRFQTALAAHHRNWTLGGDPYIGPRRRFNRL